jgi:hypothetical protein
MIKIETTGKMIAAWQAKWPTPQVPLQPCFEATLDAMEPEAKRDLAAQLLRSANEAEGHPEGAPNEDAAETRYGGLLVVQCPLCSGMSQDLPRHMADYHTDCLNS